MENASKALIMAASVLLALMLISVFVYVFRSGGRVLTSYDAGLQSAAIQKYNQQFEYYNRPDNTISDIISLCNLAYNINVSTEFDPHWAVEVNVLSDNGYMFGIKNSDSGDSDYDVLDDSQTKFELKRNQVYTSDDSIVSIYRFTEQPIGDQIRFTRIYSNDERQNPKPYTAVEIPSDSALNLMNAHLTDTQLGTEIGYSADGQIYTKTNTTVYRFLFTTDSSVDDTLGIEYNDLGRVSKVTLKGYINENYDRPIVDTP